MCFDKSDPMKPSLPVQSLDTKTRALMAPFIAILFLAAVFASGCVIHDHGRGGHYAGPVAIKPRVAVAVPAPITFTFTDHHRHSVRNYYHDHPRHHGKKHKWKKKWKHKRKSHLHPGIQMQVLPVDLFRQLPPAPRGTRYIYDDDQVLLVDVSTRVVLDFINISVEPQAVAVPAPVVFTFTDHHRHSVRDYYHDHPRHHGKKHKWKKKWKKGKHGGRGHRPHGLRKHDHLPPGIHMQAIHGDLARQLPHAPHGTRYVYHEDQVLLINLNTRVVLDFINISVGF